MQPGFIIVFGFYFSLKYSFNDAQVTQTNPIQASDNHLKPTVSIPDVLLLKSGDDVSIPCNTTSTEQTTITWNYETGSFPSNVQQVGTNLVITRADLSDSGIYLCHVNTSRHVSYKVLLITVDGANISTNTHFIPPQASILDHSTVIFGNNVTIDCHVTGIPPPDIIWLLNDRLIQNNNIVQKGNRLHLYETSLKEEGVFTCIAKNRAGEDNAHTNVYVVGVMPVIDFLSESVYALTGSSVSFRCHASGIPEPNIFWYFVSVSGEVGFPESNYHISPDHTLLTIHSARQSGTVWCIARNSYGVTNAKVYLWIRLPDLIG